MPMTLLGAVQSYLSDTDGWEVDSIFDGVESMQAASVAVDTLNRLLVDTDYAQFTTSLRQLEDTGGFAWGPHQLKIPEIVMRIQESRIEYNCVTQRDLDKGTLAVWRKMQYLEPPEFLDVCGKQSDNGSDSQQFVYNTDGGVYMVISKNKAPSYCTSFDGETLTFDSYDQEVDTSLKVSKSRIYVAEMVEVRLEDDFVIPLPDKMLFGWLDLFKSEASELLRQEPMPSAARRARAFLIKNRVTGNRVGQHPAGHKKYGRKGRVNYGTRHNFPDSDA